jgi:hypothetical protein
VTAAAGPTHYYVWYRVQDDRGAARAAVDSLMRALERRTGVAGRLLASRSDASTWMEIYENVVDADAFERALDSLVREVGADRAAVDLRRHVERFAALPDANPPHGRR